MTLMRTLRRVGPWALFGLALVAWASWGAGGSGLPAGEAAPALRVPWTEGATFDLAGERGHVTVLAFWATWCPACRAEGPTLSRVARRIAPAGDRLVGVSVERGALPQIASAARSFGMTYPIALAPRDAVDRFAVTLLPTIVIVDREGRVASSFAGTVGEQRLLDAIEDARNPR